MPVCAVLLGANPEDFRPKGVPSPDSGTAPELSAHLPFRAATGAAHHLRAGAVSRDPADSTRAWAYPQQTRPPQQPASDSRTSIKVNGRGYGVFTFARVGPNAAFELAQALRDVRALGADFVQLSALIADPGLPLLTDAARALGFFFCGLGPLPSPMAPIRFCCSG